MFQLFLATKLGPLGFLWSSGIFCYFVINLPLSTLITKGKQLK